MERHISKNDHDNCYHTGKKKKRFVFHQENISYLNCLPDGIHSYDNRTEDIKHLICLCIMTPLMRYGREGGNKKSMSRLEFDSTALFTRAAAVAFFSMFTLPSLNPCFHA